MASIYDRADIYDLIESPERYAAYREHWRRVLEICPAETMLDVSIGTGSVTIPVLDLNVALSGSDLSGEMLGRCRRKIEEKGCRAELRKSDFRDLSCWGDDRFGLTACTGNSIAYVSNEDVKKVLDELDLRSAALLIVDLDNLSSGIQLICTTIDRTLQRRILPDYNQVAVFHRNRRIALTNRVCNVDQERFVGINAFGILHRSNRIRLVVG